ncbi:hypothetical protein FHW21_004679 [Paraburkholderia sp. WP4_3_2]|nr:hypothetical protein [Paraburkholderia sp. WP4_3_2]
MERLFLNQLRQSHSHRRCTTSLIALDALKDSVAHATLSASVQAIEVTAIDPSSVVPADAEVRVLPIVMPGALAVVVSVLVAAY